MSQNDCTCATTFEVKLARPTEYAEFKKVLNVGRHPAFIGRGTFERNAMNGGALLYRLSGETVAASLINPHLGVLLALNVVPAHRSHGLGSAIVAFLVPNFVRAIESKVEYFKRQGYRPVGSLKRGVSLNTQVMAREALFSLAGRLRRMWGETAKADPASESAQSPEPAPASNTKARRRTAGPQRRRTARNRQST